MIAIAVMIVGIGVAVAILYSGTGQEGTFRKEVRASSFEKVLHAIPSDASLVACVSDAEGLFDVDLQRRMAVSLHYAGTLLPLYVFDAGPSAELPGDYAAMIIGKAESKGLKTEYVNLSSHSLVLASKSESLLKSSLRHIDKGVSILDAEGFAQAQGSVTSKDYLVVNNGHSSHLIGALMTRSFSQYASFFSGLADWTSFNLEMSHGKHASVDGRIGFTRSASSFINVFAAASSGKTGIAAMLPSSTCFAACLPLDNYDSYLESYQEYLTACRKQSLNESLKSALENQTGMSPMDFLKVFDVKEVATASFVYGGKLEAVNLIRIGKRGYKALLGDETSKKNQPSARSFRYGSFLASLFGDLFELKDESSFAFRDGWIISGSTKVVEEYAGGHVLDYTLEEYLDDSDLDDMMSESSSFISYISFSELTELPSAILKDDVASILNRYTSCCDHMPAVLTVRNAGKNAELRFEMFSADLKRTKTAAFDPDTVVVVPQGPFSVKNSGTGKMNLFYQNKHLALCLQEEDGKGLWGVPFDEPICGRAGTIDYFANGKLQIAFAAGTKLYLIDRLGRFVKGFPVELGKKVRLGPDLYDFNGTKKYNIMVLHDDNTIDMYNLKGQKPASWKSIRSDDTIKDLPERIIVGGTTFWVVRTSVQTLIFPFYGGEPLTLAEGGKMIRPDSRVTVADGVSVSAECYDGKVRTIKLK